MCKDPTVLETEESAESVKVNDTVKFAAGAHCSITKSGLDNPC